MIKRIGAAMLLLGCLGAPLPADEAKPPPEFKSGPQVGDRVNGAFKVLCANGDQAGKNCCPV